MNVPFSPASAWEPLPTTEWNASAARHLLRRAGWTARPADVERAVAEGLARTLERLFPRQPQSLPKSPALVKFQEQAQALQSQARTASGEEKVRAQRELRDRSQAALQALSIQWLQTAARTEHAAFFKWVLFLGDIYVVSLEKVKNPLLIHRHFELIGQHALDAAPLLTKAVSRSPAMINYLDLNQSRRGAPNENFARELFELFVLGEGNYTEADIKEAARAFTGYRATPSGEFRFMPNQHDSSAKTVFGRTGRFGGDDVIDLAYAQPAAARFLPQEMSRFYLNDAPLPAAHLATLGDWWKAHRYDLRALAQRFFGSRLFFAPEFRGNYIKSPIQFYLGLVQDLELQVTPVPRHTLQPLRQMGQTLFGPPNVRGWVGGRSWINSSTLSARRQLVEMLFAPLREDALNADDRTELAAARESGTADFTVSDERLAKYAELPPAAATAQLVREFLASDPPLAFETTLRAFLASEQNLPRRARRLRLRNALVTLLQSPEYQLC